MKVFYVHLFRSMYVWSAKQEFDKQPSLYSAVLYVSAVEVLNILTVTFFFKAYGVWGLYAEKWVAGLGLLGIFAGNWVWALSNESAIRDVSVPAGALPARWASRSVYSYLAITAVLFVVSLMMYVGSTQAR